MEHPFDIGNQSGLAPVNRMIPLSTVDGPGARTAVFLQSCNLSCVYCHNPETQNLCNHCGTCVSVCPAGALLVKNGYVEWLKSTCIGCDACIHACPYFASPKVAWMSATAVMEQILPNTPFIRGITVSGGECTLYPAFLTELFTRAHACNLTCLIDSNGMIPFASQEALMDVTDGVMLDVKAWKPNVFRALTGRESNTVLKENLAYLNRLNKINELRIVYLPGMVDAVDAIHGIAATLGESVGTTRLKLIAFRHVGVRGQYASTPTPSADEMEALREVARNQGFCDVSIV